MNKSQESRIRRISAPAKINLHLEVLGLRTDGFHELAMVMQSIDLVDYISIKTNYDGLITMDCENKDLSLNSDNLVIKAANLLRLTSGNESLGANFYLEKNIPIGAGLAGGSTDGAAVLFGLNDLWGLHYSKNKILELSSRIGSDMPFCCDGGTQICFGKGEILEKVSADFSSLAVLLIKDPNINISTPWAYRLCKQKKGKDYLINENQFEERRNVLRTCKWLQKQEEFGGFPLRNDLQDVVQPTSTSVETALKQLSGLEGSLGIAMSGSGPTCFALFPNFQLAKEALTNNKEKLAKLGFNSWACSFRNRGVAFCDD